MATIAAHYFQVCTQGAKNQGLEADGLLRAVGLDAQQIRQPLWRGDVVIMSQLVRTIWQQLDDELMGFTHRPVRHGAFALMAELALGAETVLQALDKGLEFYRVVTGDIITERVASDRVRIEVTFLYPELDPDHYFLEFWMIIWHRFACWLAGITVPLHRADFNYSKPREYLEEFKYLFPCEQRFEQPVCAIELDLKALQAPVRRTVKELQVLLKEAPLELMTIPASDRSITRRIRLYLHDHLHLAPTLESVSVAVRESPERLRRQLRREGTRFGQLLEHVRRDEGVRHLLEGNCSVEEIASMLGYREARSFTRAFRHWTGSSPREYRRVNRDGQ